MSRKKETIETRYLLPSLTRGWLLFLLFIPLFSWQRLYFYHDNTKLYLFLAVSEIAILCFLWCARHYALPRLPFNILSLLVLSFIGLQLLAGLLGENPLHSFWGSMDRTTSVLSWLHLGSVFVMMTWMFPSQAEWRKVFRISVGVALVISLIFFLTFLFPEATIFSKSKGGSTFGNSSFLGTYLLFHVGFAAYLALTEKVGRGSLFTLIVTVMLALTLLFTTALAAKLAFLGGCLLFLFLFLFSHQHNRFQKAIGVTGIVSLTITFFVLWFLLFQPGSQVRQSVVSYSSETRFILWDIAWQGVGDHPVLGWGPENFQDVFQTYYNPCLGSSSCGAEVWFDRSHNKILDVLVETGVVGLAFYLSLFVVALMNLWRALRRGRITRPVFASFSSLLLAYAVQNLTVFDTVISHLFFVLTLAFVIVIGNEDASQEEGRKIFTMDVPTFVPFLALGLIPMFLFWFVLTPLRGNMATADAVYATVFSERLAAYEKAVTLSPHGIDLRRSLLAAQTSATLLRMNEEELEEALPFIQAEFLFAEKGLRESIEQSPLFLRAYLDLAFLYQVWAGAIDEQKDTQAETILQQAISGFPRNPLPYWGLAGLYLEQGKNAEALLLADQALILDPTVRASQLRYMLALHMTGQTEKLQTILAETSLIDPSVAVTMEPLLAGDLTKSTTRKGLLFRFYYYAVF